MKHRYRERGYPFSKPLLLGRSMKYLQILSSAAVIEAPLPKWRSDFNSSIGFT